jgi:hypothetical protein
MNNKPNSSEISILVAIFLALLPALVCAGTFLALHGEFAFNQYVGVVITGSIIYFMVAGTIYFRLAGKPMLLSIVLALAIMPFVLFANIALFAAIFFGSCVCSAFGGRSSF